MVATKKTTKKKTNPSSPKTTKTRKVTSAAKTQSYDDFYINFNDATTKRKHILTMLKNSLVMQEELEEIYALRAQKKQRTQEIKQEMKVLEKHYLKIKKLVPNVKNILSHTEKEILELDSQINSAKSRISHEIQDEKLEEKMRASLTEPHKKNKIRENSKTPQLDEKLSEEVQSTSIETKTTHPTKTQKQETTSSKKKPLTKLDRIKNNLKVIESKLNNL